MVLQIELSLDDASTLHDITRDLNYLFILDDSKRLHDWSKGPTSICPELKKASKSKKYQLKFVPYDLDVCKHKLCPEDVLSCLINCAANQVGLYVEEFQENEI